MIKIAILADVHANYPALIEVLKEIEKEKCDYIYHLGDLISIGAYPRECLELLLHNEKVILIMGNHEEYFVKGLSKPQPNYMSDGEFLHQKWTHSKLGEKMRKKLEKLPLIIDRKFKNTKITFLHSPFKKTKEKFTSFINLKHKYSNELDNLFCDNNSDIIVYGHTHIFSDLKGKKRYINPGSTGCHKEANAIFSVITIFEKYFEVKHCKIPYDKETLVEEMEIRKVPEREFINKTFFKI